VKKKTKKSKRKIQPYSLERQIPHLLGLNNKEKLSIFVGAGISASCGLPDWACLLNSLRSQLEFEGLQINESDDVANLARDLFDSEFNAKVASCLYKNGLDISESALSIARSGVRSIICFNFDDILEEIFQTEGIPHKAVLNGEKFNLNNDDTTIFHPHGYLGRFDSELEQEESRIILSKSDYDHLYENHYCLTNLIQLSMLMTRTVFFVGMSMTDPNTIRLLKKAREVGVWHWHYALMRVENDEQAENETKRLRGIGVDPVWYKDHSDIPRIMRKISKS
jgi:NAD-dependent SIR2 family protein deacetylase